MKIVIYLFLAVALIAAGLGISQKNSLNRLESELDSYLAKNYPEIKANYEANTLDDILFSRCSGYFSAKEQLDAILNPYIREHYVDIMHIRMNGWNFFAIATVFGILGLFVLGLNYVLKRDAKS